MGDVVKISKADESVISSLEEALAEAKKSPKKAVIVTMLEDTKDGWDLHTFKAGTLLHCVAMAARLLHRMHQAVDES